MATKATMFMNLLALLLSGEPVRRSFLARSSACGVF